jgi:DNA mismatch endonuclease (patch repair protein)
MSDTFAPEKRSAIMRAVRGKNTKPECMVRSALHRAGYRFRLHRSDLPGKPDIVLPKHRTAIFVHGCFWHGHSNPACRRSRIPKSRTEYWTGKFERNISRDQAAITALESQGWRTLVLWECELRNAGVVTHRVRQFLDAST